MYIPAQTTSFPDNSAQFSPNSEALCQVTEFLYEPFYFNNNLNGATNKCYLRKEVVERLKLASSYLPDGIQFKIYDGWRPFSVQKGLYDNYRQKVIKSIPGLEDNEIDELTKLFVSPPIHDKFLGPVHATGGSVDLTLADMEGNELDLGTEFDCFKDTANTNYFELNNISEAVRNNRRILYNAMTKAGFTNLPTEWWHYDFGNKFWAYYTKKDAIYECIFDI